MILFHCEDLVYTYRIVAGVDRLQYTSKSFIFLHDTQVLARPNKKAFSILVFSTHQIVVEGFFFFFHLLQLQTLKKHTRNK